jgi:hypothetical protein
LLYWIQHGVRFQLVFVYCQDCLLLHENPDQVVQIFVFFFPNSSDFCQLVSLAKIINSSYDFISNVICWELCLPILLTLHVFAFPNLQQKLILVSQGQKCGGIPELGSHKIYYF